MSEERFRQTHDFLLGLSQDRNKLAELKDLVFVAYTTLDRYIEEVAGANEMVLSCASGCHICCPRGGVDVELFEAVYLVSALCDDFSDEVAQNLISSKEAMEEGGGRLGFAEMFLQEDRDGPAFCPMLNPEGKCHIYDSRPIACRLHVSASREVCEEQRRPLLKKGYVEEMNQRLEKMVKKIAGAGYSSLCGIGGPVYQAISCDPEQKQFSLECFGRNFVFD